MELPRINSTVAVHHGSIQPQADAVAFQKNLPPPCLTLLIGPPGAGKSTERNKRILTASRPTVIISRDDDIERRAAEKGVSYQTEFQASDHPRIEGELAQKLHMAFERGDDVIVDRNNMSRSFRAQWIEPARRHGYNLTAVNIRPALPVLLDQLKNRETKTGKHIPMGEVVRIITSYEAPGSDEFDHIEEVHPAVVALNPV